MGKVEIRVSGRASMGAIARDFAITPEQALKALSDDELAGELKRRGYRVLEQRTEWKDI